MFQKAILSLALILISLTSETVSAGVFYNNPGSFTSDNPRKSMESAWLVRVKSGANAQFYSHMGDRRCPALIDSCRRRGYLVPGDIAVAAYAQGAFTIVEFTGPTGKTSEGAIESRLLERVELPNPRPQDWLGHWQDTDERDIVISKTIDRSVLGLVGHAMWGSHDPRRIKIGAVNIGDFGAYMKPTGGWGGFVADIGDANEPEYRLPAMAKQEGLNKDWAHYFPAEAENTNSGRCRASFRLLGPYLLAYTPLYVCGGMNVTFTGVYRRVAPPVK